jgi:predicted dehydrogenase/threonine dehydrogenase-like Zn-dependent dehydrogenase
VKQLVQSIRSGDLRLVDCPTPIPTATEVLVEVTRSVVSAGTEKAVRNLASASLLQKAKARPDLVKQVIKKARSEGLRSTAQTVQAKLDSDMPLGYSAAGIAVEVGEYVNGVRPGMRVATGGAGHAEFQVAAGLLCVPIPDSVSDDAAAFSTVAAIALHGLRLAEVGPGGRIAIVGLGLLGQLATRLALASGLQVVGIDLRDWTAEVATKSGARGLVEQGAETTQEVLDWTRGLGVDAVLVTAATSSSEPMMRAPAICRDRANIVLVGDVGLELKRTPLYEKELSIKVARSYGHGRYERAYEEYGVDYPAGNVRWTEGRNIEAVLDLMSSGRLKVDDLVTHRFAFDKATKAYDLLNEPAAKFLGIELEYETGRPAFNGVPLVRRGTAGSSRPGIGLLGAGAFARSVLVPALKASDLGPLVAVASATGVSAAHLAEKADFERVAADMDEMLDDDRIGLIVIATDHASHAELVVKALRGGKHVFVEKPLATSQDELAMVQAALEETDRVLAVGFNRRHSPALRKLIELRSGWSGPASMLYRVSAGRLPEKHWYHDRRQAGRLIGEVCHFIDTCLAVADDEVLSVAAAATLGSVAGAEQDLMLSLQMRSGSIAGISYAIGGHPSTPKERLEYFGSGHTVVIDDFRSVHLDGKSVWSGDQDKGHRAQFAALAKRIATGDQAGTASALRTTSAVLDALAAVLGAAPMTESLLVGGAQ